MPQFCIDPKSDILFSDLLSMVIIPIQLCHAIKQYGDGFDSGQTSCQTLQALFSSTRVLHMHIHIKGNSK